MPVLVARARMSFHMVISPWAFAKAAEYGISPLYIFAQRRSACATALNLSESHVSYVGPSVWWSHSCANVL